MRVVIAPDSFKGSVLAGRAAAALRRGWLDGRPGDEVLSLPLADGGEGTLDAIATAPPSGCQMSTRVDGPAGPIDAPWLLLPDGTAVAELAVACGLPMWPRPDPLGAHTGALGQVLRAAAAHPDVRRLVIALGGSASTDGGVGALRALGAEFALVDLVDIDPARVHGPDGLADDLVAACADYEASIRAAGGVDVQILGISTDGHIAFNEPGSSLASRTRIKTLTRQTRIDNARFFDGDVEAVPVHCLTQGIGTIMAARHIVLVASGRAKAEAVHRLIEGPISALWPATILQMHPHVTVIIDPAAAGLLQLADYYRDTLADKPTWQAF